MSIEIRPLGESEYESWDTFVGASLNGTIFHKSYWLKASGRPFDLWGAYKSDNLVGGYIASRKSIFGRPVVAPPFLTAYSGIVLKKDERNSMHRLAFEQEVAGAFAEFLPRTYSYGIQLFSPGMDSVLPFIWDDFTVRPWFTYLLDVSDLSKAWQAIQGQKRRDIKKAEGAGLKVLNDVPFGRLMALVQQSYARQGLRFREKEAEGYFVELNKRNRCRPFLCVDGEGRDLAGIYAVWDERRIYSLVSGFCDDTPHKAGAAALCQWEMMRFASEELRIGEMDVQGTEIPRIEAYQRHFGGRLVPHYEIRWGRGIGALIRLRRFLALHHWS